MKFFDYQGAISLKSYITVQVVLDRKYFYCDMVHFLENQVFMDKITTKDLMFLANQAN